MTVLIKEKTFMCAFVFFAAGESYRNIGRRDGNRERAKITKKTNENKRQINKKNKERNSIEKVLPL